MFDKKIFATKTIISASFFWLSIIAVSIVAGCLGGVLTLKLFPDSRVIEPLQPVILQDRSRGSITQNVPIDDIVDQMARSMVEVTDDAQHVQAAQGLMTLPTVQTLRGYALAVTTDGWMVTTLPVEKSPQSYRFITKAGTIYGVEKALADSVTGVTFVKIAARNLRPIQFSRTGDHPSVRQAYLFFGWDRSEQDLAGPASYLSPHTSTEYSHSTLAIGKRILGDRSFSLNCMPLVSDLGDVLGCTASQGVVPFYYLQSALQSILRTGTIRRPDLSFQYIDLSQAPSFLKVTDTPSYGAYIQSVAISAASPSHPTIEDQIGVGDIITHVNDDAVDANHSLAELISQYQQGDAVTLKIHGKSGVHDIRIKL